MRIALSTTVLVLGLLLIGGQAMAHTPLFSCYDNGDGTVTCEGGFSDGSSAAGVAVHIKGPGGSVVQEAQLDEFGEITFDKPADDYSVMFDAGEGHKIEVPGSDIVE